ncbi:MAG: hypothetical protein ACI9EW_000837 [Cellvibrionaceae bacterium]|jgi:hypothetical protein
MENFKKGAGGTPGGVGDFIFGAVLTLIALYLISNQVRVTSGFFSWRMGFGGGGVSAFGLTMIFMIIGVVLIFIDGKSRAGWIISGGSILFTFVGIIASLRVYFASTTLFVAIGMFVLLAAGIGLMIRGVRPR